VESAGRGVLVESRPPARSSTCLASRRAVKRPDGDGNTAGSLPGAGDLPAASGQGGWPFRWAAAWPASGPPRGGVIKGKGLGLNRLSGLNAEPAGVGLSKVVQGVKCPPG